MTCGQSVKFVITTDSEMTNQLDRTRIPYHIAIIMDGNGRWATERGQDRRYGHQAGVDTVRRITSECARLGVKFLTLYTFSTENWNRPLGEVEALMGLILSSLEEGIFMKNNVRLRVVGDLGRIPENVRVKIEETVEHTSKNSTMTLVIALSYSSRWEITKAVREISAKVKEGKLKEEEITEDTINNNLVTNFMPDPDLMIRTGGELRISNYLLWQLAYSELYFCDTYWPDFDEEDLHNAIIDYQTRQRRYGKTEAQVDGDD